jgi:hypothetical protein
MSSPGPPDGYAARSSASTLPGRPALGDAVARADRALFAAVRAHRSGPAVSAARTVSGLAEPRIGPAMSWRAGRSPRRGSG